MTVIAFLAVVLGFVILMAVPFVIAPKIELRDLHKRFNALELNSVWTFKSESTNPFNAPKARVVAKRMGTDGKTPWLIIESSFGPQDYMKFEDFDRLYIQI